MLKLMDKKIFLIFRSNFYSAGPVCIKIRHLDSAAVKDKPADRASV